MGRRQSSQGEILDLVRSCDHPVTSTEIGRRVGITREQAAFHLRQLGRADLVTRERQRIGRQGSGPYLYSPRPTGHVVAERAEDDAHQDEFESWWAALDRVIRQAARQRARRGK